MGDLWWFGGRPILGHLHADPILPFFNLMLRLPAFWSRMCSGSVWVERSPLRNWLGKQLGGGNCQVIRYQVVLWQPNKNADVTTKSDGFALKTSLPRLCWHGLFFHAEFSHLRLQSLPTASNGPAPLAGWSSFARTTQMVSVHVPTTSAWGEPIKHSCWL